MIGDFHMAYDACLAPHHDITPGFSRTCNARLRDDDIVFALIRHYVRFDEVIDFCSCLILVDLKRARSIVY